MGSVLSELSSIGLAKGWPKTVDELEQRITEIIKNIPKLWFKKAFESLPERRRKCVKLGGKMTDFYIDAKKKSNFSFARKI